MDTSSARVLLLLLLFFFGFQLATKDSTQFTANKGKEAVIQGKRFLEIKPFTFAASSPLVVRPLCSFFVY